MRGKKLPLPVRILLWLIILGVLFYAGMIAYICIEEGKAPKQVSEAQNYDAIIVLGAQVKEDGTLSVQLTWRLDAAVEAWQRHQVPIVVCGAKGSNEPVSEAEAMSQYLAEHGVPDTEILKDPDSFNTRQNLENAKALLSSNPGIQKVLIVTSDYHVPRSLALARDHGFDATGLGSPCKQEYWLKNHAREALAWIKYLGVKYLHLPLG